MKYVEVEASWYTDNGSSQVYIKEIPISVAVLEKYGDELGNYLMNVDPTYSDQIAFIMDWEVFDKPFMERIQDFLNAANMGPTQQKNLFNTIDKTKKWLFKFDYNTRMDFLIEMFGTFHEAHTNGMDKIIRYMNEALGKTVEEVQQLRSDHKDRIENIKAKKLIE